MNDLKSTMKANLVYNKETRIVSSSGVFANFLGHYSGIFVFRSRFMDDVHPVFLRVFLISPVVILAVDRSIKYFKPLKCLGLL
jgi:hypothetical protein